MRRTFAMSLAAMILVLAAWSRPSQETLADPPSPKPVNPEPAKKAGMHLKSFTVTTDGTNYIFKGVIHNNGSTTSPKQVTVRVYAETKLGFIGQKKTLLHAMHLPATEANKSYEMNVTIPMTKAPTVGNVTPHFILSLNIPTGLGNSITQSKMATAAPAKESK